MRYKWVEGSHLNLNAQVVGEEIEKYRQWNGGKLSKEMIVEIAKDPSSPLHKAFEWNDTKAAEEYRLQQAGYMIRSIAVVFEHPDSEKELEVRAFVSVLQPNDEKATYTSIEVAMADDALRSQVFADALKELNAWKKKYEYLKIFQRVFQAIEELNEVVEVKPLKNIRVKN